MSSTDEHTNDSQSPQAAAGDEEKSPEMHALIVGATGRIGLATTRELLNVPNTHVRAIVRSQERLPKEVRDHERFHAIEANLTEIPEEKLTEHVQGVGAVLCALGHRGLFGGPRRLVTDANRRLVNAVNASKPKAPVRFVTLNTVGVSHPTDADLPRGFGERAVIGLLSAVLPAFTDSVASANYFTKELGGSGNGKQSDSSGDGNDKQSDSSNTPWVMVRPDTFIEAAERSEYEVFEQRQNGLFDARETDIPNTGHFMAQLATDKALFEQWKFKMPVILNKLKKESK